MKLYLYICRVLMKIGMKNRIIAFANLKGGVGKTSICIAFANYLTLARIPVVVVDADSLQQNIVAFREKEKEKFKDSEEPWKVLSLETTYSNDKEKKEIVNKIKETLTGLKQVPATILIDCPGNASDDALKYIYNAADYLVIPMDFSEFTVHSTKTFAELIQAMKDGGLTKAKLFFQPNKFDERRKQLSREEVKHILKKYGVIGTRINNRADIERISTYTFPARVRGFFKYPFEYLTKFIYGKEITL